MIVYIGVRVQGGCLYSSCQVLGFAWLAMLFVASSNVANDGILKATGLKHGNFLASSLPCTSATPAPWHYARRWAAFVRFSIFSVIASVSTSSDFEPSGQPEAQANPPHRWSNLHLKAPPKPYSFICLRIKSSTIDSWGGSRPVGCH